MLKVVVCPEWHLLKAVIPAYAGISQRSVIKRFPLARGPTYRE
jgi:hypothetical protein